jgi:hypothetical protein
MSDAWPLHQLRFSPAPLSPTLTSLIQDFRGGAAEILPKHFGIGPGGLTESSIGTQTEHVSRQASELETPS